VADIVPWCRRPLLNALASALLFALIFGMLVYYGYGKVEMTVSTTPSPSAPAKTQPEASTPSLSPRLLGTGVRRFDAEEDVNPSTFVCAAGFDRSSLVQALSLLVVSPA
jgi:hypothetical protein